MSGYPLSPIQTAYCRIHEAESKALDPIYRSGLLRALQILLTLDHDADAGMDWTPPGAALGPVT